jgi:hypothetical protein
MGSHKKGTTGIRKRKRGHDEPAADGNPAVAFEEPEILPSTAPDAHYQMSASVRNKLNLPEWLNTHSDDPALVVRPFCFFSGFY